MVAEGEVTGGLVTTCVCTQARFVEALDLLRVTDDFMSDPKDVMEYSSYLAAAFMARGDTYMAMGDYLSAETAYRHQIKLERRAWVESGHPRLGLSLYVLAACLERQEGRDEDLRELYGEALKVYDVTRLITPELSWIHQRLAQLSSRERTPEGRAQAAAHLKRASKAAAELEAQWTSAFRETQAAALRRREALRISVEDGDDWDICLHSRRGRGGHSKKGKKKKSQRRPAGRPEPVTGERPCPPAAGVEPGQGGGAAGDPAQPEPGEGGAIVPPDLRLLEGHECAVCLEGLEQLAPGAMGPEEVGSLGLSCGHRFHDECFGQWRITCTQMELRFGCPHCKKGSEKPPSWGEPLVPHPWGLFVYRHAHTGPSQPSQESSR
jgi:hypothetical protein